MKRIRLALAVAAFVVSAFAGLSSPPPASACNGDPCDGICIFWNSHPKLFETLHLGSSCGLR